jgi:hypothetical protein
VYPIFYIPIWLTLIYIVVVTTEGEQISNLIAGYIDLLLRKQKDTGVVIEDDDTEIAEVQQIARVTGFTSATARTVPGIQTVTTGVNDIRSALAAMDKIGQLFTGEVSVPENS